MMGGFGFGGMLFGGLLMLAFSVLVILGLVWLVGALARGGQVNVGGSAAGPTPLDILKTRYAKSELTKEQYEQMKRDLGA